MLPAETVPGGTLALRLVMTKFGGGPVEIGWELRLE